MAKSKSKSVSPAGVFEGHTPRGYSELTVVDATGLPVLRVFARDDIARTYELEALAYRVLDVEVPIKRTAPSLRLI